MRPAFTGSLVYGWLATMSHRLQIQTAPSWRIARRHTPQRILDLESKELLTCDTPSLCRFLRCDERCSGASTRSAHITPIVKAPEKIAAATSISGQSPLVAWLNRSTAATMPPPTRPTLTIRMMIPVDCGDHTKDAVNRQGQLPLLMYRSSPTPRPYRHLWVRVVRPRRGDVAGCRCELRRVRCGVSLGSQRTCLRR